jgi:hypothetical protein
MKTTMNKVWIAWTVRAMGADAALASFKSEDAAKDHCRALNAASWAGRHQVERGHVVAGRMV